MNVKKKLHRVTDMSRGRSPFMQDPGEVRMKSLKINETEALGVYIERAKEREDIRAQHGPCYRIDPVTGSKTLIE